MNLWRFLTSYASLTDEEYALAFVSDSQSPMGAHLWIDQISINQSDVHERSAQVSIMSQIYSQATEVICWPSNSQKEMELIAKGITRWLEPEAPVARLTIHEIELMEERDKERTALLKARYWNRSWIQQELVLAEAVRLFSGQKSIIWTELCRNAQKWTPFGLPNCLYRVDKTQMPGGLDLFEGVEMFRECQCSEVRDHIYAFMGLIKDSQRLEIDYSRPVEQIWWSWISGVLNSRIRALPSGTSQEWRLESLLSSQTTRNLGMDCEGCIDIARAYIKRFSVARIFDRSLMLDAFELREGGPFDRARFHWLDHGVKRARRIS
jgi:hypothetical protein